MIILYDTICQNRKRMIHYVHFLNKDQNDIHFPKF